MWLFTLQFLQSEFSVYIESLSVRTLMNILNRFMSKQVLSAYEFEMHAGGKTRHPNNHIYLENGNPIYRIIQELKTAPLSQLEEVVKDVAGSSINEQYLEAWKGGLTLMSQLIYITFLF